MKMASDMREVFPNLHSLLLFSFSALLFACLPVAARLDQYDFKTGSLFNTSNASDNTNKPPANPETPSSATSANPFLDVAYHSGYVPIGTEGGEMFYWYFPRSSINGSESSATATAKSVNGPAGASSSDIPFVVWLTGGPGCSSELAALTENGPLTVQPNATVDKNPYSWSTVADIVFIDQPLGTGFSTAGDPRDFVTSEKGVAEDMHEFLVQFIALYPEVKNRPFYITGESYAGHYIPSVAHKLLQEPIDGLNFEGVAIGNGWVDPINQYPAYADFALANNMIGNVGYMLARQNLENCVDLIDKGLWILAVIQCNVVVDGILGKKNPYDIRMDCEVPPMCYNTTGLDSFMNRVDVQRALGVHKKWRECNSLVSALMLGDWVTETRTKVGELLNAKKKVLVYSGDKDFICNWMGGLMWVEGIEWEDQEEFRNTEFAPWMMTDGGLPVGEIRLKSPLAFIRVFNAGHMVPMDQPIAALDMIKSFFNQEMYSQSAAAAAVAVNTKPVKVEPRESVQRDFGVWKNEYTNLLTVVS